MAADMIPAGYEALLADLKNRIRTARVHAALSVNRELIQLYWHIGRTILERQEHEGWGSKVIDRLADDLRQKFPDMKGLSQANLFYMRAFADAYPEEAIVQQFVGQLPWGHSGFFPIKLKKTTINDSLKRKYFRGVCYAC
jgi:predicted nuclease of restriction endonuclease-like (RecB) superfamily